MRISAVLVLFAMTSPLVVSQTGGKVEDTLKKMEHDWTAASQKKDTAALDQILADDWAAQGPTGPTTKAEALADLKSGNQVLESITLGDMRVREFGDTAIVTGSDDEKSSYKGKDTSGHYNWTDVFVKRHGKWQAVASQLTLASSK